TLAVALFECCYLPSPNSSQFPTIIQIWDNILNDSKIIRGWDDPFEELSSKQREENPNMDGDNQNDEIIIHAPSLELEEKIGIIIMNYRPIKGIAYGSNEHTESAITQQNVGLLTSPIDQTEQMCDKEIQTDQTPILSTVYDSVIHSLFPKYSSTICLPLPSYRDCVDEAIPCTDSPIPEISSPKGLSSILLPPLTSNRLSPPPSSRRLNRLSDIDSIKNTSMQTEQETDTSWWIESSTNARIKFKELRKQIQLLSKNRQQTEANLLRVLEELTLIWKVLYCEDETDDDEKENFWPLPAAGECLKTPINGRLLSNQPMLDENVDESGLITRINSLCQLIMERLQVENKWHMDYEKDICDNNKLCNNDDNQIKLIPLDIDHYNDELTMLNNQLDKERKKTFKYDILQQLNNEKEKELKKVTEEYAMLYYEYEAEHPRNIDLLEAKDRLCDHIKMSDE
ncbi:unnamed protein product, partial [Didymodactylos carnosus]